MATKDAKKTELKERRKAPLVTPTDLGAKASVDTPRDWAAGG